MSILDRLRAATGPDRKLDGDIAVALNQLPEIVGGYTRRKDGLLWYHWIPPEDCAIWEAPEYSGSIDAALALMERILPGSAYELRTGSEDYMFMILRSDLSLQWWPVGATAPLAILATLFTALEAR